MTRSEFERLLQGPVRTEQGFGDILRSVSREMKDILQGEEAMRVFSWISAGAARKVPKLLDCTGASLREAVMHAVKLGLLPDGIEGAIVPFGREATFIPMYQGYVKLAYNHPKVASIMASAVYEADGFTFDKGRDDISHTLPRTGKRGEFQGAYFKCELTTGGKVLDYMTKEECNEIKAEAPAGSNSKSPWMTKIGFPRMCEKTVLRRNARFIPKSKELQAALDMEDDVWRKHSSLPQVARATIRMEPGDVENHTHPGEPVGLPAKPETTTAPAAPLGEIEPEPDMAAVEAQAAVDAKWVRILDSGIHSVDEAKNRPGAIAAVEEELAKAKAVMSAEVFESLHLRVEALKAFE